MITATRPAPRHDGLNTSHHHLEIFMKLTQLVNMLNMQHALNERTTPNWMTLGHDWTRAIFVESGELIDHLGWKWWKEQKPNIPQAKIEFVDIWHFVLSHILQSFEGDTDKAAIAVLNAWSCPASDPGHVATPQRLVEVIGSYSALHNQIPLDAVCVLAERLGISDDDLYGMYIAKNTLNTFRQDHGYKEGTYVKMWGGAEDNVFLETLMDNLPSDVHPDTVYQHLSERYDTVLNDSKD